MQALQELPFVGGHVALDFVNTAEERGHPEAGDVLLTPADLRLWGGRRGVIDDHAPGSESPERERADELELARAIAARELLYEVVRGHSQRRRARPGSLARLAELIAEAYAAGSLVEAVDGSVGWEWDRRALASVRHIAVTSSLELLGGAPDGRLKQCPGDHCGWLFLDTTKRGNRRWCSMAECGQDAKDEQRRIQRAARRAGGPERDDRLS